MQIAIVKRQPKRRCRIPRRRRPHPNLDYFFGRFERTESVANDNVKLERADLEQQLRSRRRH